MSVGLNGGNAYISALAEHARWYAAQGWVPLPIPAGQKGPTFTKGWTTLSRDQGLHLFEQALANGRPLNMGLRTGSEGGFVVVDLDAAKPEKGSPDGLTSLLSWAAEQGVPADELEVLTQTVTSQTPSGGLHILFAQPPDLEVPSVAGVLAPGVDLRGAGGQIVAPPSSCHPTSPGSYTWLRAPWAFPLLPVPHWLRRWVHEHAAFTRRSSPGESARKEDTPDLDTFRDRVWLLASKRQTPSKSEPARLAKELVEGGPGPADGAHEPFLRLTGLLAREWPDARPETLVGYMERGLSARASSAHPPHEIIRMLKGAQRLEQSRRAEREGGWRAKLSYTDEGAIKQVASNATIILRNHDDWKGVLGYDLRKGTGVFVKPPPFTHAGLEPEKIPRELTDTDASRVGQWFVERIGTTMPTTTCAEALAVTIEDQSFDLFEAYLQGLRWDGAARLDTWLNVLCGAEQNAYTAFVGSKWLISAVARTFAPGCQVDHMLVLEGEQGKGKSTTLRNLLPHPDLFTDQLGDISNKDGQLSVHGPVIIEASELDAFSKKEHSAVKKFVSLRDDRLRKPFARSMSTALRRCVFAGSTNEDNYLKDSSGNRRYWPVRVHDCRPELAVQFRDQLWAEAVFRYRAGEPWHPPHEGYVLDLLKSAQEERFAEDPWADRIGNWIEENALTVDWDNITLTQIARSALFLQDSQLNVSISHRIGDVVKRLGFERVRSRAPDGARPRVWRPTRPDLVQKILSAQEKAKARAVAGGAGGPTWTRPVAGDPEKPN